jgi:hypothetical protein
MVVVVSIATSQFGMEFVFFLPLCILDVPSSSLHYVVREAEFT